MCLTLNFTQSFDQLICSDNIFELILTTSPAIIKSIHYCDGLSDHKLLLIDLSLPVFAKYPISKIIYDYNGADYWPINR